MVLVLYGIIRTLLSGSFSKGIWFHGFGVVITVTTLFLLSGWNHTAYYPSLADLQSSLTIMNNSSSPYTPEGNGVGIARSAICARVHLPRLAENHDFHKFDKEEMKVKSLLIQSLKFSLE